MGNKLCVRQLPREADCVRDCKFLDELLEAPTLGALSCDEQKDVITSAGEALPGVEQDVDAHTRDEPPHREGDPRAGREPERTASHACPVGLEGLQIYARWNDVDMPWRYTVVLDQNASKRPRKHDQFFRARVDDSFYETLGVSRC